MMNTEEFRPLYDEYYAAVYQFVRYHVPTESDVEDVIQNTFIKVARHYKTFAQRSSLKTWILAIAKREISNFYHGSQRTRENVYLHDQWDSIPDPVDYTATIDTGTMIRLAISSLPANLKSVIVLRLYHELSHQEIAQTLRWSAVRVRVTYMRALKQLRRELAHLHLGADNPHQCIVPPQ